MRNIAPEVVSIAEACLGGLQGRSALLVGPEEQTIAFEHLLRQAKMKYIYKEEIPTHVAAILPFVQLLISTPANAEGAGPLLTAATIARGCQGRRAPLLIFDLAAHTSVEELAGLLPAVCLYTPDDLRRVLSEVEMKAS